MTLDEPKVDIEDLLTDYVLIVYDIPKEKYKLRNQFLAKARKLGAMQHTESCYLLPYSPETFQLASELASNGHGHVVVWQSHQVDPVKAKEITDKYGGCVKVRLQQINNRLATAAVYSQSGKMGLAWRMFETTKRYIVELGIVGHGYNPPWFKAAVAEAIALFKSTYGLDTKGQAATAEGANGQAGTPAS